MDRRTRSAPLALLAVCGAPGGDAALVDDAATGLEGGDAAAPRADGPPPGDGGPLVPATHGSLPVSFEVDVTGAGSARLGQVTVDANAVAYTLRGVPHVGVAYHYHKWLGYTLHDIVSIATDGSNLAVTYLYCQGSDLPYAYTESFVDAMDWEPMTGTCAGTVKDWAFETNLPALAVAPTAIDTGMSITGTDIQLDASGGHLDLAGVTWDLVPFNTVDCSTCPGGPWYELHVVLMRPGEACFTILYLYPDDPGQVRLALALCLPSLATPDAVYAAAWSGTLIPKRLGAPLWRPAPPPLAAMREIHGDVVLSRGGRP
jgi:hypothetical protein